LNISNVFVNALSAKFNIIDKFALPSVDHDFQLVSDRLLQTKKQVFAHNDRYIISHLDTDYYLPSCPYGLSMFNLVRTFLHNDISLNILILITNHKNIKKEFEILIPTEMQEHNFPTIIDNCLTVDNTVRVGLNQHECNVDESSIVKHGVSMFGVNRLHRNMLYNMLVERNLLDAYAVSYKGNN